MRGAFFFVSGARLEGEGGKVTRVAFSSFRGKGATVGWQGSGFGVLGLGTHIVPLVRSDVGGRTLTKDEWRAASHHPELRASTAVAFR